MLNNDMTYDEALSLYWEWTSQFPGIFEIPNRDYSSEADGCYWQLRNGDLKDLAMVESDGVVRATWVPEDTLEFESRKDLEHYLVTEYRDMLCELDKEDLVLEARKTVSNVVWNVDDEVELAIGV